jgi:hypothetical protein
LGQLTPPENQRSPERPRDRGIDRRPVNQLSTFQTPPDSTGQNLTWEGPIPDRPLCGFSAPGGRQGPNISPRYVPTAPAAAANLQNDLYLRGAEGDSLLKFFKDHFAIHFPYVVIPTDTTSDELRSANPWLHRSVMMVASQGNRPQQLEMAKQIATDIATAMLLRGEKSLDMLQSLILYNAWSVSIY